MGSKFHYSLGIYQNYKSRCSNATAFLCIVIRHKLYERRLGRVKRNPTNHKYTYSLKSQEYVLFIVGVKLADARAAALKL